ncbi:hypothetical protein PF672P1_00047 [Parabacteroides phage PF672P1]|nr:hypothetical protein PF672P1_00047 [Parabacteroides phage PF672P1]
MEIAIKEQSIKQGFIALLVAATIYVVGYWCASAPYYLPSSKIEEGTIVLRDDSVTTIIIPDKL